MTTAVNTLQDIAQACDLPPEVVRAVVMNSDRPEAMHLELTAGWHSHLGADVIDVQDSFIHFTARDGGRWWELHAIDEGGYDLEALPGAVDSGGRCGDHRRGLLLRRRQGRQTRSAVADPPLPHRELRENPGSRRGSFYASSAPLRTVPLPV